MDQQRGDQNQPKTYQEWIEQEINLLESMLLYEEALALTEDKYEPYLFLGTMKQYEKAKAYRIDRSSWPAVKNLRRALEQSNNKIDRLIAIDNEFEQLQYNYIALDIYGLIKEIDPNYDHQIPNTLEDYENIVKEYIRQGEVSSASRAIEKYIELSDNKLEILLQIGKLIVEDRTSKEQAEQYFERALKLQEDEFVLLLRIGDIYLPNFPELFVKYYEDAKVQRPDSFEPHLKIIAQQKLWNILKDCKFHKINKFFQILVYYYQIKNKPIMKELSQNQFETLFELANLEKLNGTKLKELLLEKALAINGNVLNTLVLYAMHIYIYEERSQDTINALNKVRIRQKEEAIEELKKGAQICLQYLFLLTLKQLLLEEALYYFNRAIQLDAPNSTYDVVKSLFESNYFEECIKVCDKISESISENDQSYLFKTKSLFALKRQDEALPILEKTISLDNYYSSMEAKEIIQQIENIKSGKQEDEQQAQEAQ